VIGSRRTTFEWEWAGSPLKANQGFEIRIWKEGQPDHYGAADAKGIGKQTRYELDVAGAYGVQQGGDATYFWTVAVVQLDPYLRIGEEAAPRRIAYQANQSPTPIRPYP